MVYVGLGIHMPWLVCGGPRTAGWCWHFPSALYESQELLSIGRHSKSLYLLSFSLRQVVTNRDLKQSTENREMLDCLVLNEVSASPLQGSGNILEEGQKGQMSWRVGKLLSEGHCLDLMQPLHLRTHCCG